MTFCEEIGRHGTGFELGYGARDGVQYVHCLRCGEEIRLQWDMDDVGMFLRTSPDAN